MSSLLLRVMTLAACVEALAQMPNYTNLGRSPTEQEINAWNVAVAPSGKELPPGSGTAKQGAQIYAQKCAGCHGPTGAESPAAARGRILVGGQGTIHTPNPVRTIGSYWAFATTLWDYINRAMPQKQEGTLQPDEVYAATAFLLYRNGVIRETDVMDAQTLPKVQMPNRNGFVPPRPDWKRYQECSPNRLECINSGYLK